MENKLDDFIIQNSYYIYEYINAEVLKNIGEMNPNYFVKIIQDIFIKDQIKIDTNILPYFIFTQLSKKGRVDYTSLRNETINFSKINKEASTYYNYVKFSLEKDFLLIELKQSKIGGMPIDEDIVKFSKEVPVKKSGLEIFISENKNLLTSNNKYKEIEKTINSLFL